MASLNVDSELMTNYISAMPVPAGGKFVMVLDEHRRPMTFCLGSGSKPELSLLRRDSTGHSDLLHLNDILGVPANAVVQTFHLVQSWSLSLYMCVAWREQSSTTSSGIILPRPFKPGDLVQGTHLPAFAGDAKFGLIQDIHMTPTGKDSDDNTVPDVYLVHKALNQATAWGSDMTTIRVDPRAGAWGPSQPLSMPENVTGIKDVRPACGAFGKGLYVLYMDSEGRSRLYVRFLRPDPNGEPGDVLNFAKRLQCPEDATAIATFLTPEGQSCLLIATSNGVRILTPQQAVSDEAAGTLIYPSVPFLRDVQKLTATQDKTAVSLWFSTTKKELGYLRTDSENFGNGIPALLRQGGFTSAYSACVTAPAPETGGLTRQMLISNDFGGNLSLMEQSSDLGLWKTTPFYAPTTSESTPVKSYTVTVKAKFKNDQPAGNAQLFISSSSAVTAITNGCNLYFSREPAWFPCDAEGALDFIIPTDSLTSQVLRFEKLRDANGRTLDFERVTVDPAAKVMTKMVTRLGNIKNAQQFSQARTESGKQLIDQDAKLSDKDLEAARVNLLKIGKAYLSLSQPKEHVHKTSIAENVAPANVSFTASAAHAPMNLMVGNTDLSDLLMDGWNWVKEKVDEAVEWGIRKAGEVWEFVCTISGELKKFVLDCLEKVSEAASWVWEKIKVGWNKLCDFVGFLFNWGDILATKDTISNVLTSGLGYASQKILSANTKVDEVCDGIVANIDSWSDKAPNESISNSEAGKDKQVKDAQSSTSCNWASERLKNGGAGSSTKLEKSPGQSHEAQNIWDDIVAPAMRDVGKHIESVGKDVMDLFKQDGTISADQLLKVGKNALKAGVESVRSIIKALIKLVAALITKLKDLGNTPINIPIFTWLYKKISQGHDLTLFDAVSLLVAVPTTVFAKLITGKAPPQISNLDSQMMGKLLSGDTTVSAQVRINFNILKAEITVGLTLTSAVIGVLKLLWKSATGGVDAAMDEMKVGPSSLFDLFAIAVDVVGTIVALPNQEGLPGADFRTWISYISCARGVYHTIFYFVKSNDLADRVVLCLDLLTVLANLGLSIAVFDAEKTAAATWNDYDEETCHTSLVTNGLNTVAGVAYFTAFFFKHTNPPVSAVGAAIMVGTVGGSAALEGIIFKHQYDLQKHVMLTSGPPF